MALAQLCAQNFASSYYETSLGTGVNDASYSVTSVYDKETGDLIAIKMTVADVGTATGVAFRGNAIEGNITNVTTSTVVWNANQVHFFDDKKTAIFYVIL